jgi:hypothetical protein
MLSFANKTVFALSFVPAVAVTAAFLYDRWRRETLTRRLGELPVLGKVIASASPQRRAIKAVILGTALTAIMLAIARPQIEARRAVEVHGLDLVVAVDVSKSMLVDDVGATAAMTEAKTPPSRLARARELAVALIDALPDDRFGPVVFAGAASHFPLTEDREVASRFLYDLGPADLPPGSNLAEVFRVSRCVLRPDLYDDLGCAKIGRRGHGGDPLHGESLDPRGSTEPKDEPLEEKVERGKAIAIITDGGDPDAESMREVATARELGIAVFVIGVGSKAGGLVYDIDPFTGKRTEPKHLANGATVTSTRDDAGMQALAVAGGDDKRFFIASETGEVDPTPIVAALHAVNRGLATKHVVQMHDVFEPFLFAGFMLLVIEAAIGTRRRRKYPEER